MLDIDITHDPAKKANKEKIWKIFMKRHWRMFVLGVAVVIAAIIGAILVFLWLAGDAQASGLVPRGLGSWAMVHVMDFILHLIFWEVLLIGIPLIICAAFVYYIWYKKLPKKERELYKRGKIFNAKGGTGMSFLIYVLFVVKVYIDGNWHSPFSTWRFDYCVDTFLWALIIILVLIGIPVALGGGWWIWQKMKD